MSPIRQIKFMISTKSVAQKTKGAYHNPASILAKVTIWKIFVPSDLCRHLGGANILQNGHD